MKTVIRVTSTDLPGIFSADGDSEFTPPPHNWFASHPINLISTTDVEKSWTSSADTSAVYSSSIGKCTAQSH